MLKIITDMNNNVVVTDGLTSMPIREFCKTKRIALGLKRGTVQIKGGITHPTYMTFEAKGTNGLKVCVAALEVLGYDIILRPKE